MKKILSIIIFILLATPSYAATLYAVNAGGTWGTAATWSTVADKDTDRVGDGSVPTNADTVIIDDYSGNVTVGATATCLTLNMAGYTGTLALATYGLSVAGDVTLPSGGTITGTTGYMAISASATITSNSNSFPNLYLSAASGTYTLADDLSVTGILRYSGASTTMSGAHDISCGTLNLTNAVGTITLVAGRTLTVGTAMNISAAGFQAATITSSASTNIVFNGLASASKIAGVVFTNIAVTGTNTPVLNWFGGTLTSTSGITNVTNTDFSTGGGGAWGF